MVYILLGQHGKDVIYQDAFIVIDRPQRDNGSRSANGVIEEEQEVELPLEKEEEEEVFLFISMEEKTNRNYLE